MKRPQSQLVVNVAELQDHPGRRRSLVFDEWVEGLRTELARVEPTDPLHFELTLEALEEGGILVRGPITGTYVAACRRCLEETRREFRVVVAEVYRTRAAGVWEEGYVVDGEVIDLRPAVRDNVVLDLPLYPLCREDCLGLCSRCGGNRNRGECACPPEERDDRWAELRRLLGGS